LFDRGFAYVACSVDDDMKFFYFFLPSSFFFSPFLSLFFSPLYLLPLSSAAFFSTRGEEGEKRWEERKGKRKFSHVIVHVAYHIGKTMVKPEFGP
jgi:hypothetical protein